MTEEGFRKRFRIGRPETGETFSQFGVRMESYFTRWLEMSGTASTFDALKDFVVKDQVLQTCGHDLTLFIKEWTPKTLAEMTEMADQYAEARGNPTNLVKPKFTGSKHSRGGNRAQVADGKSSDKKDVKVSGSNIRHCYICKKTDHLANRCPKRDSNKVGVVDVETSTGHAPVSCGAAGVKMPVVMGYVGNHRISVLRDSGCGKAVVMKSLVSPEEMTGKVEACKLADGTVLHLSTARIMVDTPYYTGRVEAWVMETPIYDLMLGNMVNVRPAEEPDSAWEHTQEASAVQTRAQAGQDTTYRPLKVPKDLGDIDPGKFKDAQLTDGTLAKIREFVKSGQVKERQDGSSSKFTVRQGLIYREYKGSAKLQGRTSKQLVVPSQYRGIVLRLAHDSVMAGHLGAKRTADRILLEFYWPGIIADVSRYCRSCDVCQRTFPKGRVTKVPLGRMPLIDIPFQRVAIDLVGPLQPATDRGNRYILTLVDYATRYPEAVALKGIEAERVAEALVDIYSRVGVPREVLTDQGSQFTSEVMKEVSMLLSIRQLTTTPYHPMCNGLVERYNGTLKQMLRRMCSERPKDWDKYLNALLFSYREVPQESLGFSPFELLYGRVIRGPMRILRELCAKDVPDPEVKTTYQYVVDLRERLEETCKLAREHPETAKVQQAHWYNKKAKERKMKP
ncbi:uncharacterized protein LOC117331096 [Pecten maximus]|uniref:uncharacterized protein LOC117331096 n=1 Tax=Pecten maximus TaxID=6579 RepID=UPI001458F762|nr:uncharacterized protein LOC117331096 [Pecten maximus]